MTLIVYTLSMTPSSTSRPISYIKLIAGDEGVKHERRELKLLSCTALCLVGAVR